MLVSAEYLLILGACKVRTRVPRSAGTHFQVKRVLPRDSASKTPLEPLLLHVTWRILRLRGRSPPEWPPLSPPPTESLRVLLLAQENCHANLCLRSHITRVWLQSSVHFCLRHLLPCKSLPTFTHHSCMTAIFRSLLPPSSIAMQIFAYVYTSLVSDCNLPFTFASVIYCHANLCLRSHITRVWLQSSVHFCLRHLLPCKSLPTFTHHSCLTAIFRSLLPPSSFAMQIFAYVYTAIDDGGKSERKIAVRHEWCVNVGKDLHGNRWRRQKWTEDCSQTRVMCKRKQRFAWQ